MPEQGSAKTGSRVAAGLLAGVVGIGAGHLAAAAVEPESAPVLAIAASVVDLTPQPVKQWAIDVFGTGDKAFLLVVVGIVAAIACALAGYFSRRSVRPGIAILIGLGVLCAVAALTRPVATIASILPSVVTAAAGCFTLKKLIEAGDQRRDLERDDSATSSRRRFLALSGAAAGVGIATLAVGQWLISAGQRAAAIVLPRAKEPLAPLPAGLEKTIEGISPFRTPNDDFYRIDTALTVPSIDPHGWRLTIDGDVENKMSLSLADLQKYEVIERDITMTCVSNEVGGEYIGSARWLGVRVSDVLADAGIKDGVDQIFSEDVDGMTISTPVAALTDDREALLAFGMNGDQLPRQHGFPVRLVTPGLYGFVGSTKWVTKLTATTYAAKQAYWTERDWVIDAPVLTQSRIDTPKPLATVVAAQSTYIAGVAWAQGRGVAKVEVQIDDGAWSEATFGPDAGIDYWRQWYLEWTPTAGQHTLRVRATDGTGQTQTTQKAPPFPSGATGQQSIVVRAE